MKFLAPLALLLVQGVLAAPVPEGKNRNTGCCEQGTPHCPEKPDCECPKHSHWDWCGSACPETCCEEGGNCGTWCIPGCVCDEGRILNNEGKCVWPWECEWEDCCDPCYKGTKKLDENTKKNENKKKGPRN